VVGGYSADDGGGKLIREKCGVTGIRSLSGSGTVAPLICNSLYALQHRGQESCGIYVRNGSELVGHRSMGMVANIFDAAFLMKLGGVAGVGHVRYSTTASSTIVEAQPYLYESPEAKFALAFNGTIINFSDVKAQLAEKGHRFETATDTEVLAHLIGEQLKGGDYFSAFSECMKVLDGAYSLTLLDQQGDVYGVRDPMGFKPLCWGYIGNDYAVIASETVALDTLGGIVAGEIEPGEVLRIGEGKVERQKLVESPRHAFCMFEYVYFARPDSFFHGTSVYDVRFRLGRNLARSCPANADLIVPIPDSGRTAAAGYAQELGMPLAEGLIKNRYIGRTFIMPTQDTREVSVKLKLNPVKTLTQGKDIVLVDDSIVRGTTMRRVVRLLKSFGGARSVHVRISCPPIRNSCYMGIDFPTVKELVAAHESVEDISRLIGADSLGYQNLDGLIDGIGLPESELCMACLTGVYPLKQKPDLARLELELGRRR